MICNVCAEDKRCLTLSELTRPTPISAGLGISFNICMDCLAKLIEPIKIEKTVIDDPKEYPLTPQAERFQTQIAARKAAIKVVPIQPIKTP
jgi:hypothetical protein